MKSSYQKDLIQEGVFGAMMNVEIVNDGLVVYVCFSFLTFDRPVTITIESTATKEDNATKDED